MIQKLLVHELPLKEKFLQELELFNRIIVSVSGGVDSTAVALELHRRGYKCELLWNNTMRSMKESRETIAKLANYTKWPLHITIAFANQKKLTKQMREYVRKIIEEDLKYEKHGLRCCYHLKEKPLKLFFRSMKNNLNVINISSIAPYEGQQRRLRMIELRKKGTFIRYKRVEEIFFGYPLRDFTHGYHGKLAENYVKNYKDFRDVKSSSCHTCPVVAMFVKLDQDDPKRIERSKRAYLPKEK